MSDPHPHTGDEPSLGRQPQHHDVRLGGEAALRHAGRIQDKSWNVVAQHKLSYFGAECYA